MQSSQRPQILGLVLELLDQLGDHRGHEQGVCHPVVGDGLQDAVRREPLDDHVGAGADRHADHAGAADQASHAAPDLSPDAGVASEGSCSR